MKTVHLPISLADSVLKGYSKTENEVVADFALWDDRAARLKFKQVVGLRDFGTNEVAGIVQLDKSDFFAQTLERNYEGGAPVIPFVSYALVDPEDEIVMEIVSSAEPTCEIESVSLPP